MSWRRWCGECVLAGCSGVDRLTRPVARACRSDGYSCQREQVTQGIFRHVHPMTQQLLIMWEEPPRIVFVLKKLGRALLPQLMEVRALGGKRCSHTR